MGYFGKSKSGSEVEKTYHYESDESLAKTALEDGGDIHPLIIPGDLTNGTGIMNPSLLSLGGGLIANIRHVNYTFYHSEKKLFQHPWGPLVYLHPENDMKLRTDNYYCELDDSFSITRFNKIDTSQFDTYEPMWDFVGLEDVRLINWDGKLYGSGVRRDTTTNGQGRMELSELDVRDDSVVEVSRVRIQPPVHKDSYCEKNWMPVLDDPYTYVKWSNPTEVVNVDPIAGTSSVKFLADKRYFPRDPRGGSQVIPYKGYHLALTHEVDLFDNEAGRKDGIYRHRFVLWDRNWNVVKYSNDFSIMNGHVEFSAGMCEHNGKYLISFGYQDNAAFILEIPEKTIDDVLGIA